MHAHPTRFLICSFACLCLGNHASSAATYKPDGDIIGSIRQYTVRKNDNISEIARRFDIGIVELLAANPGVTQPGLKAGRKLTLATAHVLPAPRRGIVLNLSELRLFYFADDHTVMSFPVGIGREGWETPTGITSVVMKRKDPTWTPPDSIRAENPNLPAIVPAGPDNPLGQFALTLGLPGYLIHGTNRPYSVGKRASHGCIRLYPEDIAELFDRVDTGMPVTIIDVPYKLGWQGNRLFLEVTPTQSQSDAVAKYQPLPPRPIPDIYNAVRDIAGLDTKINWQAVDAAMNMPDGIPVMIGRKSRYTGVNIWD